MIHEISKETFIEADDKTTKALTYDLIKGLYDKFDEMNGVCVGRLKECSERFRNLENRKLKDTFLAGSTGLIGGFLAYLTSGIKKLFGG